MEKGGAAVEAAEVGMSADRVALARSMVHRHVDAGGSPSVVALVMRHGKVVLSECAGVQGPHGAPLEMDHVWPLASAGKPITAGLVMSLVEDGLVGINESAVTHLPELAGHEAVLVHHLLTHTAGWESAQRTKRLDKILMSGEFPSSDLDRDPITQLMLSVAFDPVTSCGPGIRMDYDNGNYELLSEMVRRSTGTTFDAAMRERIFEPAGATHSAVIVGDDLAPRCVTRPPRFPFGPDRPLSFQGELFRANDSGAMGIHMTPLDLARFAQMILEGGTLDGTRVLSPAAVRAMVTNRVPGLPALFGDGEIPEASWGYGFTVVSELALPYFIGALVPDGSVTHPGAGGIAFWIDFEHDLVGVWFEVIAEISEYLEPVSGIGHRFQNVITAAIVE